MFSRIVVSGGWSYGNLGDEIIAKCTIELLNRYFPNVEKVYTSFDSKDFCAMHNLPSIDSVHSIFSKQGYGIKDINDSINCKEKYGLSEFAGLFTENTLFIMSGGGYFDGRWDNQFASRIVELKIAKEAGAKTAIIGQSIGPLVSSHEADLLSDVLDSCDFINVRDEASKILINNLLPQKVVSCLGDIAITISDFLPIAEEKPDDVCNLIVQIYTEYVANSISQRRENATLEKIKKRVLLRQYKYDWQWIRLLKKLNSQVGCKCNIVLNVKPTEKISNAHFEIYAKKLKRLSKCNSVDIISLNTIEDFCKTLSNAQMIISCKMHPLIISSSYGVRTYALSQHYKIDSFMNWIGRDKMCCKNSSFKANRLIQLLTSESEDSLKESLRIVDKRKQEIYKMFETLSEL